MNALRTRLIIGTILGTTLVLLVACAALYVLIQQALTGEFDAALTAKARALATLTEQSEDGLESELTVSVPPEFEPGPQAEYFQLWQPSGALLARSPSLGKVELPRFAGADDAPAFRTLPLPDGRPGRLVGLTVIPRQEFNWRSRPPPPQRVTLVLGRATTDLATTLARVRGMLIGVGIATVVLAGGVLAWVVGLSLRSLAQLGAQIAQVGGNDLSARVAEAGLPAELRPVVARLNALLARLQAAFEREQRFTGDVAHELRTPLAGLRARLELALTRERAPEAYRQALADSLEIGLQMQRLVETLLSLARADAGQLDLRTAPVDVSALLQACWTPLAALAASRQLQVAWNLEAQPPIATDADLLRVALQNVLDNAVAYADTGGLVHVTTQRSNRRVCIAVTNTGCRLAPADVPRVFDRFWRGDTMSALAGRAHVGLGLALTEALAHRLGGTVTAAAHADRFTLTLSLPAHVQTASLL